MPKTRRVARLYPSQGTAPAAVSPNQPEKERQPDHPAAAFQATAVRLPLSSVSSNPIFSPTTTTGISYYLLTGNYGNAGRRFPASDS